MKKIISLIISIVSIAMLLALCSININAVEATVEKDGVMQIGDVISVTEGYFIYYPKELETSDKIYPVAVWANGTACAPAMYYDLLVGVAKKGYVVVACSDVMSKDGKSQISSIDYIFEKSMDESSPLFGKIDPNRVGAFGHSQGGLSCVNAALNDSRIGAIVSIAGASTSSQTKNLKTPALFLTGSLDSIVLSSIWVKPSYNSAQGPAAYASLENGVHVSCMANAEEYIDHIANWFDAWLNEGGDLTSFRNGSEFSSTNWKNYQHKNLNTNYTGSIFDYSAFGWVALGMVLILLVVASQIILYKKIEKLILDKKDKQC